MTIVDPYGNLQLESQSSGFSRLVVIEESRLRMQDQTTASTRRWKACRRPGDECRGLRRVVGRSVGGNTESWLK